MAVTQGVAIYIFLFAYLKIGILHLVVRLTAVDSFLSDTDDWTWLNDYEY